MYKIITAAVVAVIALAPALEAQGIQLIAHRAFANESASDVIDGGWSDNPYAEGALLGLDISGKNLGIGVSAYSGGDPTADFGEIMARGLGITGEVNYFLRLPMRFSPYVGAVVPFAVMTEEDGFTLREFGGFGLGDLGWQIGLRWKPIPIVGLDLRTRALRGEYATGEEGGSSRQWLLGLTLF